MKKSTGNLLLLCGALFPLVLLLWPFAQWRAVPSLLLRVIAAVCAQLLLCRAAKHPLIRLLPFVFTGLLALWGTYLYFTSPYWINATFWDLTADYVSPFLGCAAVYATCTLKHIRK